MSIKLEWKKDNGQYANGSSLYIKKFQVGGIAWDASRPKGSDIPPYRIYNMFGVNPKITHFENEEKGKQYLEKYITSFIKYLTE